MTDYDYFNGETLCRIIKGKLAVRFPKDFREMPLIKRQKVDLGNLKYIGFQNTRRQDSREPSLKTVGFFLNDDKFECVCKRPWKYIEQLSQYKQVMSPDVSCYTDMSLEEQWYNTFLNRVIGSYWQSSGLIVIRPIAWSDYRSYQFVFAGVEKGCSVSVSTIGTKKHYELFMGGFIEMCNKIQPENVICYCPPYQEMHKYANVISIEYEGGEARRIAKYRPDPNQLSLFDYDYYDIIGVSGKAAI